MSAIQDFECQADGCEDEAQEIVITDEDVVVLLCWEHENASAPYTLVQVRGRQLLRDTAGTWWFLPERGEATP